MTDSDPRDAASLLLLRDGPGGGPPEVYMLRRHPKSEFMGEAYVFPGGALDAGDSAGELAPLCDGLSDQQAGRRLGLADAPARARAFYVAGLRETFEEAGLLLCAGPVPGPETFQAMRDALNERSAPLGRLLREHGVRLDLGALRVLDHWLTPVVSRRRFDTWFFVARAPAGLRASFNPRESTDGRWLSAAAALREQAAGRMMLAPPTLCILQDLARQATVEAALAAAPDRPVPVSMPELHLGAETPTLLLPGDRRHSAGRGQGDDYVTMVDGRWRRVRGPG